MAAPSQVVSATRLAPLTARLTHALWIALAVAVLTTLTVGLALPPAQNRHSIYLADSFAHGVFSVNTLPDEYRDKIKGHGETFLPFAPMPALLLVPVAAVWGTQFDEIWLAYLLTACNVLLVWRQLRLLGIPARRRMPFVALLFAGSIYLSSLAVGRSWFLAHIVATTFLLLAVNETLGARRPFLLGAYLGMAFLARTPTIMALPFFLVMSKPPQVSWLDLRWMLKQYTPLALGLALPLFFFVYYNEVRFGSVFETGYGHAIVGSEVLRQAMDQGLFSPVHIAKNLYAFLLAVPQAYPSFSAPVLEFPYLYPSPWGLSILITTPAFLYAFRADHKLRLVRAAWLAAGLILCVLLLYYGVGWSQFGYRYALDLYPFLFLLTVLGLRNRMTRSAVLLIGAGILVNVWGAWWQMIGLRALPIELTR